MKAEEISFKDLSKGQLDTLKDIYIDNRIKTMTELELRKFAREVLELQVRGTVGNDEEREVWKEMKEHFDQDFEKTIKEIIQTRGAEEVNVDPEKEDFRKRLELLEQRKQEESKLNDDMW